MPDSNPGTFCSWWTLEYCYLAFPAPSDRQCIIASPSPTVTCLPRTLTVHHGGRCSDNDPVFFCLWRSLPWFRWSYNYSQAVKGGIRDHGARLLRGESPKYNSQSTWTVTLFLLRDHHLLIVLVADSKGLAFLVVVLGKSLVSTRCRIFLHVALHPVWVGSACAITKASSLALIGSEAAINEVARFSACWFNIMSEPNGFGHGVTYNRFL